MNLSLLNPFHAAKPIDRFEEAINFHCPVVTCCQFNRHGSYLAAGSSTGNCYVVDFVTRGVVRTLRGHIGAIADVQWNKRGNEVLTAGVDGRIVLWNVQTSKVLHKVHINEPVLSVRRVKKRPYIWVVTRVHEQPVLVIDTETGKHHPIPADSLQKGSVAVVSPRDSCIYVSCARGVLSVFSSTTFEVERKFQVGCGIENQAKDKPAKGSTRGFTSHIKSIKFNRKGTHILLNCADRVIRLVDLEKNLIVQEFQECVNRLTWKQCCFSGDEEYIVACSTDSSKYQIYIWAIQGGQLLHQITAPTGGAMDAMYHPLHAYFVVATKSGLIHVWGNNHHANWTAFAPNFQELEENEIYEEKEDEFDLSTNEEADLNGKEVETHEEEEVNLTRVQPVYPFTSDEEEGDEVLHVTPFEQMPLDYATMASMEQQSTGIELYQELAAVVASSATSIIEENVIEDALPKKRKYTKRKGKDKDGMSQAPTKKMKTRNASDDS